MRADVDARHRSLIENAKNHYYRSHFSVEAYRVHARTGKRITSKGARENNNRVGYYLWQVSVTWAYRQNNILMNNLYVFIDDSLLYARFVCFHRRLV